MRPRDVPQPWRDLIRSLPGYDPFRTDHEWRFDHEEAEHFCSIFPKHFQIVEGAKFGEPFDLLPPQKAIVALLFGSRRPDNTRRYREALIYCARGNGKSTFCAGLGLLGLYADDERGAKVYVAATEFDQASICFGHARAMVLRSPELKRMSDVMKTRILIPEENAVFKVLSSIPSSKQGLAPSMLLIDELHQHKSRELYDVLHRGTLKRMQPLTIGTTTADTIRDSLCNDLYERARACIEGHDDFSFLPAVWELPHDADWTDESNWHLANPMLEYMPGMLDYLRTERDKAVRTPSLENSFRRYHCNQRTEQDKRWIKMQDWDACNDSTPDVSDAPCWAGLDIGVTTDLTAFVLVYHVREYVDGQERDVYPVHPYFFMPIERAKQVQDEDHVDYVALATEGLLELTDGHTTDFEHVRRRINEIVAQVDCRQIAYDPWQAEMLRQKLQDDDGLPMVELRQGFAPMNEPSRHFERLVISRSLRHNGHRLLRIHASNVGKEERGPLIRPGRLSSKGKIDGIVATIMAVGRAVTSLERKSVYSRRGVRAI